MFRFEKLYFCLQLKNYINIQYTCVRVPQKVFQLQEIRNDYQNCTLYCEFKMLSPIQGNLPRMIQKKKTKEQNHS